MRRIRSSKEAGDGSMASRLTCNSWGNYSSTDGISSIVHSCDMALSPLPLSWVHASFLLPLSSNHCNGRQAHGVPNCGFCGPLLDNLASISPS